jgi:hypothetical protein
VPVGHRQLGKSQGLDFRIVVRRKLYESFKRTAAPLLCNSAKRLDNPLAHLSGAFGAFAFGSLGGAAGFQCRKKKVHGGIIPDRTYGIDNGYLQFAGSVAFELPRPDKGLLERCDESPVAYGSHGIRGKFPLFYILVFEELKQRRSEPGITQNPDAGNYFEQVLKGAGFHDGKAFIDHFLGETFCLPGTGFV